jgi:hypothetical protein
VQRGGRGSQRHRSVLGQVSRRRIMGARGQDGRCQILRSRSFARVAGLRHSRRHAHTTTTHTIHTTPHAPRTTPDTDIDTQAQAPTHRHRHTDTGTQTHRYLPTHGNSHPRTGCPGCLSLSRRPTVLICCVLGFETATGSRRLPAAPLAYTRRQPRCLALCATRPTAPTALYLPATCQLLPVSVLST